MVEVVVVGCAELDIVVLSGVMKNKTDFHPRFMRLGSAHGVRISLVALRLGSEMDPYRRDLMNILHSYLVSDSFGPVLGARA